MINSGLPHHVLQIQPVYYHLQQTRRRKASEQSITIKTLGQCVADDVRNHSLQESMHAPQPPSSEAFYKTYKYSFSKG